MKKTIIMTAQPAIAKKSGPLTGRAVVPGDKSISHRAVMFGGLAEGETIISGLLEGEDVLSTAAAMRALGAEINHDDDGLWRCYGVGAKGLSEAEGLLDMGNSGTSIRLLMGVVSGYPLNTFFVGDQSLSKRPMGRVTSPLNLLRVIKVVHRLPSRDPRACAPLTMFCRWLQRR